MDLFFDGTSVAAAWEGLGALGVELLFPGANLSIAEAELPGGFGVRVTLLGQSCTA